MLLEQVCGNLSWRLPVSVTRRRDDRYTLGDLWPPVRKALQKTDVANAADEIDRWLHLRNLVGAHYNEWATVVSTSEARQFGEAVLRLYDGVKCDKCGDWIASTRQNNVYECKCRALSRQPLASTGRA